MNEYIRDGLLRDIADGKRILYVAASMTTAQLAFEVLEAGIPNRVDGVKKVTRANGRWSIEHRSGGSLRFLSERSVLHFGAGRGQSADVIYIAPDVADATAMKAELWPTLAASPRGQLIH